MNNLVSLLEEQRLIIKHLPFIFISLLKRPSPFQVSLSVSEKKKKKERKKSEQISEIVNRSQSFKPSPFPTREKNIYIYILALR